MFQSFEKQVAHAELVSQFIAGLEPNVAQVHLSRISFEDKSPYIEVDLSHVAPRHFLESVARQAFEQGRKYGRNEKAKQLQAFMKIEED